MDFDFLKQSSRGNPSSHHPSAVVVRKSGIVLSVSQFGCSVVTEYKVAEYLGCCFTHEVNW